jgi:Cof subfamily protein (haloacid dehalogenase superfamily)
LRLVASDLDGTLLRNDKTWSKFTSDVIAEVSQEHRFVAVTGRPPRLVRLLDPYAQLGKLVVCTNGSLVIDTTTDTVTLDERISSGDLATILREIRSQAPTARFIVETAEGQRRPVDASPASDAELISFGANKLLVLSEDNIGKLTQVVFAATTGIAEPTRSQDAFVEVGPLGVTKASTLASLSRDWGVTQSNTIAYGDMPNDLATIKWAGLGVAVGNAHPSLKDAANIVLDLTNEDDAVATHLVSELGLSTPGRPVLH